MLVHALASCQGGHASLTQLYGPQSPGLMSAVSCEALSIGLAKFTQFGISIRIALWLVSSVCPLVVASGSFGATFNVIKDVVLFDCTTLLMTGRTAYLGRYEPHEEATRTPPRLPRLFVHRCLVNGGDYDTISEG